MRNLLCIILLMFVNLTIAQTLIPIPEPYGYNFIESELIESVSVIPLQIERYGMIMPDMEMKVDGNNFFILDNRKTQCVYRFNENGELLNTICEIKENADGEEDLPVLNNPAKFSLNPFKQQVEIYNFENSIVNRFSYGGDKIDQMKLNISPSDFVCDIRDNYWIYTGWNKSETQYRLLRSDKNGNILDKRMRLITKCTPTEGYTFYISNTGICFWELLGNTTFLIENRKITPSYRFDFGTHKLPENYHLLKGDDSYVMLNQNGYFSIKKYIENKNFAYFFLNYSSIEQREMFHVIFDKNAGLTYVYTENAAIGAFDKAQAITKNDELIFLVSPRKARQLLRGGTEFVPATFMNLTSDLSGLRNPIILKMKLQSISNNSLEIENENIDSIYFGK